MTGLNLRHIKTTSIEDLKKKPINLYPYKNGKLTKPQKRARSLIVLFVALAIGVLSYTAYLAYENMKMLSEIQTMTANLRVEKDRLDDQKLLDELMKRIDYKSELLNYIDKSNASASLIIETIEKNVPTDVHYVDVEFVADKAIRITCVTHDQDWVAKFIHELKAEQFFDSVFVESISKTKMSENSVLLPQYEFRLICTFGGNANETQK